MTDNVTDFPNKVAKYQPTEGELATTRVARTIADRERALGRVEVALLIEALVAEVEHWREGAR